MTHDRQARTCISRLTQRLALCVNRHCERIVSEVIAVSTHTDRSHCRFAVIAMWQIDGSREKHRARPAHYQATLEMTIV
jgi:hypothetical protein